ncbi:MAG: formate--tetrahydrofolate ligase [Planctomycetota bacterium]
MKSDLEIAQAARLKPILAIAKKYGIREKELDLYGRYKAKVHLDILERLKDRKLGKYIDVTAITPTPLGEGKTVTTIGSSLGLAATGKKVFTCIRQPSMGPVFGIKGGAAGGGYSQVVPMEDFNLHLTGDIHAVSAAHNLLAAALDTRMLMEEQYGPEGFEKSSGLRPLHIDPRSILWRRVVDLNDRALREIEIGLPTPGAEKNDNGVPRRTGFDIAVASELMAILGLTRDLRDMRRRIGRVIFGSDRQGRSLTAEDLGVAGAMTVLMKEAIKPTLMQTLEGTAAFVHAGPFANIAHGNSSILADEIALRLADYVVTESGFGADIGFEKFANIKCRTSGLAPDAVVLVCTVRALKMHSGRFRIVPGKPLPEKIVSEDLEAVEAGVCNLERHVRNVNLHGLPVVVAVNRFPTDTPDELAFVCRKALAAGAMDAQVSEVWARGGKGGKKLAEAIRAAAEAPTKFRYLYPLTKSLQEKIKTIATKMYGACEVSYTPEAERELALLEERGFGRLPICMAKTHLSLTHDPAVKGAPEGYVFPVREVKVSAGAGFIYVLAGAMKTMPGLGSRPAYLAVDIDEKGNTVGLF